MSLDTDSVGLFENAVSAHLQSGGAAVIATHIDFDLPVAHQVDLAPYRATSDLNDSFDEAFL